MIYSRLQIKHMERVNRILALQFASHDKNTRTKKCRNRYDRRPLTVKETTNRQPAIGLEFGLTTDTGSRRARC